jgi:hypothetical protein
VRPPGAALKLEFVYDSAFLVVGQFEGSVLTRRFEKVGDVVRVSRGMWGLKEWYPNRSFKTNAKIVDDAPKNGTSEPVPPSAPPQTVAEE